MNTRLLKLGWAKVKFLLRDDFNDTRAAGSVNGTLATPGGTGTVAQRTRTVTDTGSKLSVGSGLLTINGGVAADGDPSLWYGGFTREAGRLMISTVSPTATNKTSYFGWNRAASSYPIADALRFLSTSSITQISTSTPLQTVFGVYAAAKYYICVVLKTSGAYFFIKGGLFTNWTLLWVEVADTTATVYPQFASVDHVVSSEFIRIPLALWLPRPIAYDTFTRANGAIGTSETSGPESQTLLARTWTGATWTIATNVAVNTPTLGSEEATGALVVGTWYSITATQANYFYTGSAIGDTFRAAATTALDANNKVKAITLATLFASQTDAATASILAGVDLVATTRMQTGIVVNLDSAVTPANFIIAYIDQNVGAGTTRILLDECVAGVYTNKITVTNATYAASAKLVVVRNGTECRVIYNNIAVGTVQTMTANTNTLHGLFSTNVANTFNDFLVMPRGTGGEYNTLDRYIK